MENKLEKIGQNNFMDNFVKTDDILKDMCGIIESSQKAAYRAVNTTLIQRNWLLGYRIASEELQGEDRAKYGAEIIKKLAKELSAEYGKGYTKSNLYSFYRKYSSEELECAVGNYLISKGVPIIDYFSHMGYKYDILAENM